MEEGHCPLSLHPTVTTDRHKALHRQHTHYRKWQSTLKPRFRWAKAHGQCFLCWVFPLLVAARISRNQSKSQVQLKPSTSYAISYTLAVPQILQEFSPSPGLLFRPMHPIIATSRLTNVQSCAVNSAASEDRNIPRTIWGLSELRARAPRPPQLHRTKTIGNYIEFYMWA